MKNKLSFNSLLIGKGMIAIVITLVLGLIVTGCSHDGTEDQITKFEGTWVNEGNAWRLVYTFTGNTVKYSDHMNAEWSGTFTFTDTEITFRVSSNTWTQGYTLEGTTLEITNTGGSNPHGTFIKQE
jgi:hypothetical protein